MWNKSNNELERDYDRSTRDRDFKTQHNIEKEMDSRGYEYKGFLSGWQQKEEDIEEEYHNEYDYDSFSFRGLFLVVFLIFSFQFILGLIGVLLWKPILLPYVLHAHQWFPKSDYISLELIQDKVYLHVLTFVASLILSLGFMLLGLFHKSFKRLRSISPYSFLLASFLMMIWEGMKFSSFPIMATIGFGLVFVLSVVSAFLLKSHWKVGFLIIALSTFGFVISGNDFVHCFALMYVSGSMFLLVPKQKVV